MRTEASLGPEACDDHRRRGPGRGLPGGGRRRAGRAGRDRRALARPAHVVAPARGPRRDGGARVPRAARRRGDLRPADRRPRRRAAAEQARPLRARLVRHADRAVLRSPVRRRFPRPRRLRADPLRGAGLPLRRDRRDRHRHDHRRRARPLVRLLSRLGRHAHLPLHGRPARLPGAPAGDRPRLGVLARRRLRGRPHPAGPAGRHHRDRARELALPLAPHPRPGAVAAREGVRRGLALARRVEHPHRVPRGPAQPLGADHRLRDPDHPHQRALRGGAVVPRRRRPAADRELGRDARRRHRKLRHGLVVPVLSRDRALC